MYWSESKDLVMMKEVAASGILHEKPYSKERGAMWQEIAKSINANDGFCVTARGVRDRLTTLMKKHKVLMNKDAKKTGEGGHEPTEFEILIEELIQLNDDTESQHSLHSSQNKKKLEDDRLKAVELRQKALERQGETRKRNNSDEESAPSSSCSKTSRRSSSDTLLFLREKLENDKKNKDLEREERAADRQAMLNQQMQMQQQFNAILAQQTQLLKFLIEKK